MGGCRYCSRHDQSVWEITDIALPSVDDEMELFGDTSNAAVIDRFSERSWDGIAIKRGIRGTDLAATRCCCPSKIPDHRKGYRHDAAGDSFNGAYLAFYCWQG